MDAFFTFKEEEIVDSFRYAFEDMCTKVSLCLEGSTGGSKMYADTTTGPEASRTISSATKLHLTTCLGPEFDLVKNESETNKSISADLPIARRRVSFSKECIYYDVRNALDTPNSQTQESNTCAEQHSTLQTELQPCAIEKDDEWIFVDN
jgi:hypothetical protein